jgi:hypothetical protein
MPLLTIAMADVPGPDAGIASGIVNASLQVAGAIGVAAMGTISADRSQALLASGEALLASLAGGYSLGFTVAAFCAGAGLLGALVMLRETEPRGHRGHGDARGRLREIEGDSPSFPSP